MSTPTTLRNAELAELAEILKAQADARYDNVVHSENIRFEGGNLLIADGADTIVLADDGLTPIITRTETSLTPTSVMEEGLATRLKIPGGYLRTCREAGAVDLYDHNLNEWITRSARQWFVRGFKADGESSGIGRAFLSDRFNCYDNFDVLTAALSGIRDAGIAVNIVGCDLSERRMNVKVECPSIQALAPALLANYRSPFTGNTGADNPTIFAGFVISNSETGGGAFTITPRLVVQVCKNGMTFTKDALRKVHLGSQMDEGLIRWSDETSQINVDLVKSQAKDAVLTFCDTAYIEAKIAEVSEAAATPVEPTKVVERVSNALKFTQEEQDGILGHFIQGGDLTAGGVMQAVTSYAQEVLDPDRANALEEAGLQALAEAAR